MTNEKALTVRKTFQEAVTEIRMFEQNLKEVVPRPPSEEAGKPIETTRSSYGEGLAEIERLQLVRKLGTKVRKR